MYSRGYRGRKKMGEIDNEKGRILVRNIEPGREILNPPDLIITTPVCHPRRNVSLVHAISDANIRPQWAISRDLGVMRLN